MRIRPCIDLHQGKVKQIVGGTLSDAHTAAVQTNFETSKPPDYYANLYYADGLEGGHVIMLGPGNQAAARCALSAHPGSLQVGGGITPDNAGEWLDAGAAKVIVTSYVFTDGELNVDRLRQLGRTVGPERLVLDLSCRRTAHGYRVMCDRWQTFTSLAATQGSFGMLAQYCSEFLVHAVDVEGKQAGIEEELVALLGTWTPLPATYAGGVRSMEDVERVGELGNGRLDVTVGSALDLFGGSGICYNELVAFDKRQRQASK